MPFSSPSDWTSLKGELAASVLTGLSFLLVATLITFRSWCWRELKGLILHRAKQLEPAMSLRHRTIMDRLRELQATNYAARAVVFQFHNGEVFMLGGHTWKMTCSFEATEAGTTYINKESVGLLVTNMVDLIQPILSDASDTPGVEPAGNCALPSAPCQHSSQGHKVLHFTISKMNMGQARFTLHEQGVHHLYTVNLLSAKKAVIGFLALQFRYLDEDGECRIEQSLCDLCEAAEEIQFLLRAN